MSGPSVIVVGSGLAGLSAAHAALRHGAAHVVLIERAPKPGGNSIKASSGINGAPTPYQKGVDISFYSDTVRSAGARFATEREGLVKKLTGDSAGAINWLVGEIGVDLSVVAQLGGHSFARTHRGSGKTPPGAAIVMALLEKLKADPKFELKTDCEVTKLLVEDGTKVTGVQYTSNTEPSTLSGAVVFATGGFAGDTWGMLQQHRPDLAGLPSTNDARPGMHGLLTEVGAQLVDMDSVQVHPTGFILPSDSDARVKFLAAEMLRGEGGILLREGRRFVNEMETREHVSREIMKLSPMSGSDVTQWDVQLLLDPGACEAAGAHVGFYLWKGLLVKKKVKELDAVTRETIREYSLIAKGNKEDALGRAAFGAWRLTGEDENEEVCVGQVTPITHFTMGGAVVNEKGQILGKVSESDELRPVEGLWAAGEITGGIHGDNRLGGSSLLECVVFGRTAGEQAAQYMAG